MERREISTVSEDVLIEEATLIIHCKLNYIKINRLNKLLSLKKILNNKLNNYFKI